MQNEERIKRLLTILIVCIVSSLLSGCDFFEETICEETEGQERNGLVYLPNQEEPFTGKNLCKYENGQKKIEGNYKDGKMCWQMDLSGMRMVRNGQREITKTARPDGKWTEWYKNGQRMMQRVNYKDNKTRWQMDYSGMRRVRKR